jgi:hypothetical protein
MVFHHQDISLIYQTMVMKLNNKENQHIFFFTIIFLFTILIILLR